jgi:class 3 adenylate cyclase/tetratricopeptide (TPR) repeat protein
MFEAVSCPSCGASNPGSQRFCNSCGHELADKAGTELAAAPRAHIPDRLRDKILSAKRSVEGERKQVTVLFADVKGSMELAETIDAETWRGIMRGFFAILCDGVHRFEGTVDKFTGDGIMALFGAPIAHEDHARRACYAALHLSEELARHTGELRREQGLNFSVRVGLNSGEVIVGTIGDDLDVDYTAIGHTVGLAQRMEQLAEAGEVYLTEHTAALVAGFLQLRDLGRFELKGVRKPIGVFQLLGTGRVRTRLEASAARGFSRFVGRDQEMATLEAALAHALEGHGEVVGVVGEPGIGKSRLCHELAERCRTRDMMVLESHGIAHGRQIPFLPILQMWRDSLGVTERDSDQAAREKIAGRLLLLDDGFRDDLPLVFDFLGVPDPERPVPRMDPEARERQLFAIGRRLTQARSRREPALFVLDDLNWFDDASAVLLEHSLIDAVAGTRTLVLANFRPEYHAGWMQKSYYERLPLVALGPEAADQLLRDLLGDDASLHGISDRIRQRTEGNPFFIEEVVQALVETGSLVGERGSYRLAEPAAEVEIPATVQAVLAARIDRLEAQEKAVLQTAAVVGREFSEPVLRAVAGLPGPDLAASLSTLVGAELLYEQALYPEAEYTFKHPLTQEVAYRAQLARRRSEVHAAVARAVVELYPDKLDERAGLLAHHWERGGELLEAARWNGRAGQWAGPNHPAEALSHWRRVLELLESVEESAETIELRLSACGQILNYAWRVGISDEDAAATFAAGKALATRSGDVSSLARLTAAHGVGRALTGALEEALEHGEEVARLAEQTDDPELSTVLQAACIWRTLAGDLREGLRLCELAIALAGDDLNIGRRTLGASVPITLRVLRGVILGFAGRLEEGARELGGALELAREHDEIETLGLGYGAQAGIAWLQGETEGILERAGQSVEIAERLGSSWSRVSAQHNLARAQLVSGHWAEAVQSAERALEVARELRTGLVLEGDLLAILAEAHLRRGDTALARSLAEQARDASRRLHTRAYECNAEVALARALLRADGAASHDAIESGLGRALELVEKTGAFSQEPFIRVELAELARLAGDDGARDRELREAERLFIAIGAPKRAARLAADLAALPS